jgi:hypothetical protein
METKLAPAFGTASPTRQPYCAAKLEKLAAAEADAGALISIGSPAQARTVRR